jgi:hypothetical protein
VNSLIQSNLGCGKSQEIVFNYMDMASEVASRITILRVLRMARIVRLMQLLRKSRSLKELQKLVPRLVIRRQYSWGKLKNSW